MNAITTLANLMMEPIDDGAALLMPQSDEGSGQWFASLLGDALTQEGEFNKPTSDAESIASPLLSSMQSDLQSSETVPGALLAWANMVLAGQGVSAENADIRDAIADELAEHGIDINTLASNSESGDWGNKLPQLKQLLPLHLQAKLDDGSDNVHPKADNIMLQGDAADPFKLSNVSSALLRQIAVRNQLTDASQVAQTSDTQTLQEVDVRVAQVADENITEQVHSEQNNSNRKMTDASQGIPIINSDGAADSFNEYDLARLAKGVTSDTEPHQPAFLSTLMTQNKPPVGNLESDTFAKYRLRQPIVGDLGNNLTPVDRTVPVDPVDDILPIDPDITALKSSNFASVAANETGDTEQPKPAEKSAQQLHNASPSNSFLDSALDSALSTGTTLPATGVVDSLGQTQLAESVKPYLMQFQSQAESDAEDGNTANGNDVTLAEDQSVEVARANSERISSEQQQQDLKAGMHRAIDPRQRAFEQLLASSVPNMAMDTAQSYRAAAPMSRDIQDNSSLTNQAVQVAGQQQLQQQVSQQVAPNEAMLKQLQQAFNPQHQHALAQLQEKVSIMLNQKLQEAEIRLDPPELGSMMIKMTMQNDQAQVSFVVQNQQAKEMVEESLQRLRDMFAQQGMELGNSSVAQQGGQHHGEQPTGQHGRGAGRQFSADEQVVELTVKQALSEAIVDYYA